MKKISLFVFYKKRKIKITAFRLPKILYGKGLMFCRRKNAKILFFDFKKNNFKIHSWFVFFPFIAMWIREDFSVVDLKIVRPFRFNVSPTEKFRYLIEIPISKKILAKFSLGKRNI